MNTKIFLFITLLSSFSVNSQWFESQGQAVIRNNDNQAARSQATQSALKKALLIAGASVSSIQQVVNGLLTQNEISIRASGSVQALELIDETYHDDMVTVTIRADILAQEKQCFSAYYRKGLLLTKSHLLHREQANIGNLYGLDTKLILNLSEQLKENSRFTDVKLALKNKTNFSQYNQGIHNEALKSLSMSLANMTNSQYIFYSEIEDISFNSEVQNGWQFWQEDVFDRNFSFNLYVYDGTNGEVIFDKKYQGTAPWLFSKRAKVDINSHTFWHSEYGEMVNELLTRMVMDIDENIMCKPTRGKILNVTGNEILINLGAKQGVKIGDEFSLLHLNNFVNFKGETYPGFNVSNYKVKITQVSQQTAKAITLDSSLLGNIQKDDLAVRY